MGNLVNFLIEAEKLKKTYRYSSLSPEARDSSADHSWKLALMVPLVAEELNLNINVEHSMKLAISHDVLEYITGEFDAYKVYSGEVTKEYKNKLEREAANYLGDNFGEIGKEIKILWEEYEEQKTRDSNYVKALDKIEAMIHLIPLAKFDTHWEYTAGYANEAIKNFPELKPVLHEVKQKLKKEYEKLGREWKSEYNYPD